jgi:hypothetical protein
MTIDIAGLIAQLGKKYQDVYDQNLIPYKSKPKSGSLVMRKESLHLYFEPYGVGLSEITLTLFDEKTKQFHFPHTLPFGLQPLMTQEWLHAHYGKPIRFSKKKIVMSLHLGEAEVFELPNNNQVIFIARYPYVGENVVTSLTFELRESLEKRWDVNYIA